jgi:hypothetical protein
MRETLYGDTEREGENGKVILTVTQGITVTRVTR